MGAEAAGKLNSSPVGALGWATRLGATRRTGAWWTILGLGVAVGVKVAVGVEVAVKVEVAVGVGVEVAVGVGVKVGGANHTRGSGPLSPHLKENNMRTPMTTNRRKERILEAMPGEF